MRQARQKTHMQKEARRFKYLCACLSVSTSLAQHANHNKLGHLQGLPHRLRQAASRLHACAIAHASFFLFLLEHNALLPLYAKCISINLDVGMFAAKSEVDQMFGC